MLSHLTLFNVKMREVTGMRHGFQFLHVDRADRQIGKLGKMQQEEAVGNALDCRILLLACTPRRICSLEFRESKMGKFVSSVYVTSANE